MLASALAMSEGSAAYATDAGAARDIAASANGANAPSGANGANGTSATKGASAQEGLTAGELEKMLAPLDDPSPDARHAAAAAIADLGADATRAIAAKLDAMRGENLDIPALVKSASHDKRDPGDAFDLTEALVRITPNGAAYAVALRTSALIRALAHIATLESVRSMVAAAADHESAFRPEIARQLQKLGERAVPGLIVARKDPSPVTRHLAIATLEAMGKMRSGDMIQTKSNGVLSDALRAFGIVRDVDALPIVISFVNADRAQVRAAAREALSAYGADALPKLREAYSNLTGKAASDEWNAGDAAKQLFSAYDRIRLQEVYTLLDDGLAAQKDGKLDEAVALFDKVLARQPLFERRAEMVPGYVQYAQSLEERDRPAALAYFRKASRLDPTGPHAGQIDSAITTMEAEDLAARGLADADMFRRALVLDPGNAKARADLDRLEVDAEAREDRVKRWIAVGAVLAIAILAIVLFGGRSTKGRSRNSG